MPAGWARPHALGSEQLHAQGAIAAAQQQRAAQGMEFEAAGKALRGGAAPEWLAGAPTRGALLALARALIR